LPALLTTLPRTGANLATTASRVTSPDGGVRLSVADGDVGSYAKTLLITLSSNAP
jgi:hypothetical protein